MKTQKTKPEPKYKIGDYYPLTAGNRIYNSKHIAIGLRNGKEVYIFECNEPATYYSDKRNVTLILPK